MKKTKTKHFLVKVSIGYALFFVCVIGLIVYVVLKQLPKKNVPARVLYEMSWPYHDMMKGSPYSTKYDGVDVSHHQGRMHWDELKKDNPQLQFMYLRVYGKHGKDDMGYDVNVERAHRLHIPIGTYMFFTMSRSAHEQYLQFHECVKKEKQDLIPVIDVEDQSIDANPEHLKDSVMVVAKLLEREYGVKPMIYSNQSHYKQYLAPEFNDYPLWIANYNREPRVGKAKPLLWQYSESGHIHGVWTKIDLDRFVNGATLKSLRIPRK